MQILLQRKEQFQKQETDIKTKGLAACSILCLIQHFYIVVTYTLVSMQLMEMLCVEIPSLHCKHEEADMYDISHH